MPISASSGSGWVKPVPVPMSEIIIILWQRKFVNNQHGKSKSSHVIPVLKQSSSRHGATRADIFTSLNFWNKSHDKYLHYTIINIGTALMWIRSHSPHLSLRVVLYIAQVMISVHGFSLVSCILLYILCDCFLIVTCLHCITVVHCVTEVWCPSLRFIKHVFPRCN